MLRYFLRQQLLRHHLNPARVRLHLPFAVMVEHTARKCARMKKQCSFCVIVRIPKWMVIVTEFRASGNLGGDEGLLGLAPMNGRYTGGVGRFFKIDNKDTLWLLSPINGRPTEWCRLEVWRACRA